MTRPTSPSAERTGCPARTPAAEPASIVASRRPPVVVVLNFSEEEAATGFKLPPEFQSFVARDALYDALAEELIPIAPGEFTGVTVPALSARILTLPPA